LNSNLTALEKSHAKTSITKRREARKDKESKLDFIKSLESAKLKDEL
jgi:hypothetical protein